MQGFKPAAARRDDMPAKPPAAPPTQLLGAGAAAKAAGFLRGRKAQIDAASNFANGGAVTEEKKPPSQMLGTGMVAGAAKLLSGRRAQIEAATNFKDGGMVKDYMNGGMVEGPGTGTSDSIKAKVPVGSYVMPADSTQAMGFKPKARQINVSDGEMIFNPKQVQAIGMQKLDKINDATHTPAPMTSTSTNFRDGGLIDDELRRTAQGRRVEPHVNWRAPNPPSAPPVQAIGYTPPAGRALAVIPPAAPKPNFIMGETPEFRAAQQTQAARAAAEAAYGERVNPTPKPDGRFGLPPSPPVNGASAPAAPTRAPGGFIPAAQRVLSTPAGTAGKWAGRALAPVGALVESVNVADVATNPNATGIDVATQAASGAGKLAGGFLGAKGGAATGAALGALGGPFAPITVPAGAVLGGIAGGLGGYMGAGKLIEAGRSMAGTDTQDPVQRLPAAQPATATPEAAAVASSTTPPSPQVGFTSATNREAPTEPATQPGAIRRVDRPGEAPMFTNLADDQQGFAPGFTGRPNAQNNAAAEALAQRSAGRAPLAQAAELTEGGGNITPETSGSGFGLLDQGARDRRSAMMDAEQFKPGARTALRALLERQANEPRMDLERDTLAARREENAADRGMRSSEAQADRALKSQELGDSMATNAVRREAAGFEVSQARQLQTLQNEYLTADTDEKRQAALKKLQALSGKQEQGNRFTVVPQGSTVDPATGLAVQQPAMVLNNQTGQFVQAPGGQQSRPSATPPEVGTVKNGWRFKGGDPSQQSSWVKM